MKKIKTFEDMKIVKNSDLENWSTKQFHDKNKYTGSKNLNTKIGYKMIEVFNNYGFFVMGVGPGDFLNTHNIVLEPEKNLREYRVELGLKNTWDNFLDWNGVTEEEFEELSQDEQNNLKKEFDDDGDIADGNMEFSVFLSNVTKDEKSAFADAFDYLKLVEKSIPQMYTNPTLEDVRRGGVLTEYENEFKKFLNNKKINITNDNIEMVTTVNHRLYKDSKFFYNLKKVCEKHDISYSDLINDLLNIK